jgi:hypothetical protein
MESCEEETIGKTLLNLAESETEINLHDGRIGRCALCAAD